LHSRARTPMLMSTQLRRRASTRACVLLSFPALAFLTSVRATSKASRVCWVPFSARVVVSAEGERRSWRGAHRPRPARMPASRRMALRSMACVNRALRGRLSRCSCRGAGRCATGTWLATPRSALRARRRRQHERCERSPQPVTGSSAWCCAPLPRAAFASCLLLLPC